MPRHARTYRILGLALTTLWLTASFNHLLAESPPHKPALDKLFQKGRLLEKRLQWQKACLAYKTILLRQSDYPQAREKYFHTLRRWLQVRRHRDDITYRKQVLALRFSQAMKCHDFLIAYLQDNSVAEENLTADVMFHKGLEEFAYALADPTFIRKHLPRTPTSDIETFRASLATTWRTQTVYSTQDASNRVRDIAKAAGQKLRLPMTVTVMEFTCGSCYAVDDYTMYLTPRQLQKLCQILKGRADLPVASAVTFKTMEYEGEAIGYLDINEFNAATVPDLDTALMSLTKKGVKALVLDLRDNHGGLVDSAIEVARRFLSSGIIVSVQSQDSKMPIVYHARNSESLTLPVVILVDGGTASAAEILAGALKENRRARLIGQTTFGKGSLQDLFRLSPKPGTTYPGGLLLTVSRFYSPNGNPYAGKGVVPHIFASAPRVPKPISLANNDDDPVLQEALEEAGRLLSLQ